MLFIHFMLSLPRLQSYNYLLQVTQPHKIRNSLSEIMNREHKYLSYKNAKSILHNEVNNIDIYGNNKEDTNIEHVFPQYLFKYDNNKNIMKSDLHNMYLCNSKINTQKQNFRYTSHEDYLQHENDKYVSENGENVKLEDMFSKQGYIMVINRKKKQFIPTLSSRGMISRSLAYFAIKYNYIQQLQNIINITTLVEWNIKDSVSNEEYYKNIICYKYQKNYNPFILEPDLLLYCFSDMTKIDKEILQKKRVNVIDPMYSIELLLSQIEELDNDKCSLQKIIKRYEKNEKK